MRIDLVVGGPDNGQVIEMQPEYRASTYQSPTVLGYFEYRRERFVHRGGPAVAPGEYVLWVHGDMPEPSDILKLIWDSEIKPTALALPEAAGCNAPPP